MRIGYKKMQLCNLCNRFLKECNSNLCRQRKFLMHCSHTRVDNFTRRPFIETQNPLYLQVNQYGNNISSIQNVMPVITPNIFPNTTHYIQNNNNNILDQLNDIGCLINSIHTVEMKYCSKKGMVVDWFIVSSYNISNSIPSYDYKVQLDKNNMYTYKVENIILPWNILPSSISSLPVNIQIQTTSQYIPPGSKFNVFCKSYNVKTGNVTFKMANRSLPVFNLPPYIQKTLTYSNYITRHINTQNSRPRFLIIIDFEATCDFSPNPLVTQETMEIIEFPWIVIDTISLNIIHEQQIFIKPQNIEGITNFCTQLTGITKDKCINGKTLSEALIIFNNYINENILPFGKNNFRIITDGNWDLEIQLKKETKKKNIILDGWFKSYFDIRKEFKQLYSWFNFAQNGPNLQTMLDAYSLKFIGRHHSGIDDCKSIAQIVKILLQLHPNIFTHPINISDDSCKIQSIYTSSRCPDGSWQCTNKSCSAWNLPYIFTCKFCSSQRP